MLDVLLTVDTELWPHSFDLSEDDPDDLFRRYIVGHTARGDFGLFFQLELLARHGLRAVFFVEPFFTHAFDRHYLADIVGPIVARGHDVQLHPHPEWLCAGPHPETPRMMRQSEFDVAGQHALLQRGAALLTEAGAPPVRAHRAGSFAANTDTLAALARAGIPFDASCDIADTFGRCHLANTHPLVQPVRLGDVCEYPVACFHDRPGHLRHVQLTACSLRELRKLLWQAVARQWHALVIVSHSFELVLFDHRHRRVKADPIAVRRFDGLCRFLAANPEHFRVTTFADLDPNDVPAEGDQRPLASNVLETAWRCSEQLARRVI